MNSTRDYLQTKCLADFRKGVMPLGKNCCRAGEFSYLTLCRYIKVMMMMLLFVRPRVLSDEICIPLIRRKDCFSRPYNKTGNVWNTFSRVPIKPRVIEISFYVLETFAFYGVLIPNVLKTFTRFRFCDNCNKIRVHRTRAVFLGIYVTILRFDFLLHL